MRTSTLRLSTLLFGSLLLLGGIQAFAKAPKLNRTTFLRGLQYPWDMAFLQDGAMLFTEKCLGLSIRLADGKIIKLFGKPGYGLVAEDLFCQSQSGMHGIALDPKFSENRFIFVYMGSKNGKSLTNKVVRLSLAADMKSVSNRVDIITEIPFKSADNHWGGAGAHSGGRLRFGPDGFLYVTTGDNHNGLYPQDLKKLAGKVLRVTRDGKGAPGNDAPKGADPRIYTYGHRNVQGLAFLPASGKTVIAEHGPGHSDEITILKPGGNGGWDPRPQPGVECEDDYCGYTSNRPDKKPTSMTDLERFPSAMKPLLSNGDSQGMGPLTFLSGPQWKDWNGRLAVGIMGGQRVDIVLLNANQTAGEVIKAPLPSERVRSLVQSPDGDLYVALDSGSIWRVHPE